MKRYHKWLVAGTCFFVAFCVLAILLALVDVGTVEQTGTRIGLFTVNTAMREFFGADQVATILSDVWLYVSLAVALAFVAWGVAQWIKRKSFLAIDKRLLALGGLYVVVALCYVMFQIVVVNYRPELQNGVLEASFPSTHVLVTVTVAISAMSALKHRVDKHQRVLFAICCILFALVMVVLRCLSGTHWFTDVIGGVLLGCALACYYFAVVLGIKRKSK